MSSLPPRKTGAPAGSCKQRLSALDVLLQMGFKQSRAEKALAATGDRGAQLASDWLLAHVNDPHLDDRRPRQFFLYACPGGELLRQIDTFMAHSLQRCGRNGAHTLLPHVTLAAPFEIPHNRVSAVITALHTQLRSCQQLQLLANSNNSSCWQLERYSSHNYIGLFLEQSQAATLAAAVSQLSSEAAKFGVQLEPRTESLHLSLAYQFPGDHFSRLDSLSAAIDVAAPADWQLRIYSRDSRLAHMQVYRVLFAHVPRQPDELELLVGDHVYVTAGAAADSPDGWVQSCSWLTGQGGFAPANYLQLTAESDAWTVHRVVSLSDCIDDATTPSLSPSVSLTELGSQQQRLRRSLCSLDEQHDLTDSSAGGGHVTRVTRAACVSPGPPPPQHLLTIPTDQYFVSSASCDSASGAVKNSATAAAAAAAGGTDKQDSTTRGATVRQNRELWVVRHGERVDFTYGQWIPYCFDESGKYRQKDINMPFSLKERSDGCQGFARDSPITHVGRLQATLTGEAMRENGVHLDHVYCSPSLRCLETAYCLLSGLGWRRHDMCLRVEPGLFEWLHWYRDGLPAFLSPAELASWGFPVDVNYRPVLSLHDLAAQKCQESCEQYYRRSHQVAHTLLSQTEGNVLFVAHAASVDTCTRQLVGAEPRSVSQLCQFLSRVPYCSAVCARQTTTDSVAKTTADSVASWSLADVDFGSLTHSHNQRFDLSLIR